MKSECRGQKRYFSISVTVFFVMAGICLSAPQSFFIRDKVVFVTIDNTQPRQVMEGFGGTHNAQFYNSDLLTPSQRRRAIDALFNQIKIRSGQVPTIIEAPSTSSDYYALRANDNNDSSLINWKGFNTTPGDVYKKNIIDLAPPETTSELIPDVHINIKWASPWMKEIRRTDYARFLDETSEQVLAGIIYWQKTYGREPRYAFLFNEPTSGNDELDQGQSQEVVDIIKRAGDRLRANGFKSVKFVVPSEETVEKTLVTSQIILADPEARQYVGAIAYHPYPYHSNYSFVPSILESSGAGRPVLKEINNRQQLAQLAALYGIPVWMTEVSNGLRDDLEINVQSYDVLRARAIHIHDELEYANASAFYGMNTLWSTEANLAHFGTKVLAHNPDDLVVINQDTDQVLITGMGYAIGHFARWLTRGAIRLESSSTDPLIQVSAFRDEAQKKLVLVLINNSANNQTVKFQLIGLSLTSESLSGEQSTARKYWEPVAPVNCESQDSLTITLPPLSVTSVAGHIKSLKSID